MKEETKKLLRLMTLQGGDIAVLASALLELSDYTTKEEL